MGVARLADPGTQQAMTTTIATHQAGAARHNHFLWCIGILVVIALVGLNISEQDAAPWSKTRSWCRFPSCEEGCQQARRRDHASALRVRPKAPDWVRGRGESV